MERRVQRNRDSYEDLKKQEADAEIEAMKVAGNESTGPTEQSTVAEQVNSPELEPAQQSVPVVMPTPVSTPVSLDTKIEDTFEQKYTTLAGKYNAEITELTKRMKDAEVKNRELLELVAEANRSIIELTKQSNASQSRIPLAEPVAPVSKSQNIDIETKNYLTPKDEEDYADIVDLARRAAKQEIEVALAGFTKDKLVPYLDERISPFAQDISDVKTVTVSAVRDRFMDRLESMCPQWKSLDSDPGFAQWLDTPEPLTDIPRRAYLNDYNSKNDAVHCANIFNTYIKEVGTIVPKNNINTETTIPFLNTASAESNSQPISVPATPVADVFVTPGSGRQANSMPESQDKTPVILDRKFMDRAWTDFHASKINMTQLRAKQSEFEQAVSEGRVV